MYRHCSSETSYLVYNRYICTPAIVLFCWYFCYCWIKCTPCTPSCIIPRHTPLSGLLPVLFRSLPSSRFTFYALLRLMPRVRVDRPLYGRSTVNLISGSRSFNPRGWGRCLGNDAFNGPPWSCFSALRIVSLGDFEFAVCRWDLMVWLIVRGLVIFMRVKYFWGVLLSLVCWCQGKKVIFSVIAYKRY